MAIKRVISTGFWSDDKVIDNFSPEDKYFMLYLLSNPHTTQLGIYELNSKQAAFELGYSVEAVKVLMDRFQNKYGIIKRSEQTNEIAIANYLRHSIIKGGKPVEDLLKKELLKIKDRSLINFSFNRIKKYNDLNETVIKIVESFMNDNDNDNEIQNDNDNDNDNDESSTVRGTNRQESINYQQIADMYNDTCASFPRLTSISDSRKKAIKARFKTYSVDDFATLFQKAEDSEFLKGKNGRDWSATFDWLIKDANMAKVLDGNYDNKNQPPHVPGTDPATKQQQSRDMMLNWVAAKEAQNGN